MSALNIFNPIILCMIRITWMLIWQPLIVETFKASAVFLWGNDNLPFFFFKQNLHLISVYSDAVVNINGRRY